MERLSETPFVHENCRIINSHLGQYTEIGMGNYFENVVFGDYSYTGELCILQNTVVKKFANIAAMVRVGPTNHPVDRPTLHHFTYRRKMYGFDTEDDLDFLNYRKQRKTIIGNDTWLGHGSIIMPGVTVGDGAVVGSGAVVTKDVEAYTIVAGVPAKPIRKRFDDNTAEKLQAIKWWDWDHELIKERLFDFARGVEEFIEKYYKGQVPL